MKQRLLNQRRGLRLALGLLTGLVRAVYASNSLAADNVAGNLININNDGMWSWYLDERAIVDPTNGTLLVGSISSSPVVYGSGRHTGAAEVVSYDTATGSRYRIELSDLNNDPTVNSFGGEDDHNAPGLMVLPNGKYLAMYSKHGNQSLGDYLTRYRVSSGSHDDSSWEGQQTFNWQTVTGWNTNPIPNNRVSYHNLYSLSDIDRVYDFSRGTHQSANVLEYFYQTTTEKINGVDVVHPENSAGWRGQLTTSAVGGYSTGYVKYASNGKDRIYFASTETHPRNYNNNVWAGYMSYAFDADGDPYLKSYDMLGNPIDSIIDNVDTGGATAVPDINQFTLVKAANTSGVGDFRLWTVDMSLGGDGNPVVMYISRHYNNGPGDGGDPNPIDHRIHYARWDGTQWQNHELARMGNRLYTGTDMSEQDYTGNGALVPGDANTVYISTQYDPRDPSGATATTWREIYKGVTANGGADWSWTPITSGSSVNNLRPIVPEWDADHTAVVWMRGTYTTAQNTDLAVVGIIERKDEQVGLIHYVDATTSNTTLANGSPLSGWNVNNSAGNGGNVITAQTGVSAIKTQLTGLADGTYDIFAYFYADQVNDWRVQAGLSATNLQLFRDNGAQQAEADDFDEPVVLTGGGGFLYQAYMGRVNALGGAPVEVFIDDFATGAATRAWYDGLGYALVTAVIPPLAGDFNVDHIVDAADYIVWRKGFGTIYDQQDYDDWRANFGATGIGSGNSASTSVAAPEPATALSLLSLLAILNFFTRRVIPSNLGSPKSRMLSAAPATTK